MEYIVYIATAQNGKRYVGITNNFKRRMKEHNSSPYPFGRALRKHGRESFTYEFIQCADIDEAYDIEARLVGPEQVADDMFYNISCGGRQDVQFGDRNCMKDPEVVARHSGCWTSENNPMRQEKHLKANRERNDKKKKKVSVDGIIYNGVRHAARVLGTTRQALGHRLKSENFPDHFFVI